MINPISDVDKSNFQISFNKVDEQMKSALEKLSSGAKITKAGDDPAGSFISSQVQTTILGLNEAQNNTQTGINYLNVTDGGLSQMNDLAGKLNELSVKASSDLYSPAQRNAMQEEANALSDEMQRIQKSTSFNGENVFTSGDKSIQVGSSSSSMIKINSSFSLDNMKPVDLSSSEKAAESVENTSNLINELATKKSEIGASSDRLQSALTSQQVEIENLSAAQSTIQDADIAKESSMYLQSQILSDSISALNSQASSISSEMAAALIPSA